MTIQEIQMKQYVQIINVHTNKENKTKADIDSICTDYNIFKSAYLSVREVCKANFRAVLFL